MSAKVSHYEGLLAKCMQDTADQIGQGEQEDAKRAACKKYWDACIAANQELQAKKIPLNNLKSRLQQEENNYGVALCVAGAFGFVGSFWLFKN